MRSTDQNRYRTIKRSMSQQIHVPEGAQRSTLARFDDEYCLIKIFCADLSGLDPGMLLQPVTDDHPYYSHNGELIALEAPDGSGFNWGIAFLSGISEFRLRLEAFATSDIFFSVTAYERVEGASLSPLELGQVSLSVDGNFDFGTTTQGDPISEDFTITNTGDEDLILGQLISVTGDFSVNIPIDNTLLLPGETVQFTVEASAVTLGTRTGTVSIVNNTLENPYEFEVTVEVLP